MFKNATFNNIQLNLACQFYWQRKSENTIKLQQVTDKLYCGNFYRLHHATRGIDWLIVFNATFSNILAFIMATSFSGARNQSTQREPPTMGKQLVNFITCGCESSAPYFCNLQSRVRTHAVLVIGLYELLGNPTT